MIAFLLSLQLPVDLVALGFPALCLTIFSPVLFAFESLIPLKKSRFTVFLVQIEERLKINVCAYLPRLC